MKCSHVISKVNTA